MSVMRCSQCAAIVVKDLPDVTRIGRRGLSSTALAELIPAGAERFYRGFVVEPSKSAPARTLFARPSALIPLSLTSSTRLTGR